MTRLAIIVGLVTFLIPAWGVAQQPSPTIGLPVPDGSITTQSDSASLELNPAGLGFLLGSEVSYQFTDATSDYEGVVPSGHALNIAGGGSAGGLGLGWQWMDSPLLGPDRSSFRKTTLGGALSPSPRLSIGGNLNFFSSRTDERLNDLRTTELGIQIRLSHLFGIAAVARDLRPVFLRRDQALPRRHGAGAVFRPFDGRLVFDTEFNHVQSADLFELNPRIAAEPIPGLRLFGRGFIDVPRPGAGADWSFDGVAVGLETSAGGIGAQAQTQLGGHGTADVDAVTTSSYRFWAGTPRKRSLVTRDGRWIHLKLDDSIEEQAQSFFFAPTTRAFLELINDIDAIALDTSVEGVVIEVGSLDLGFAQMWELHEALERLRDNGVESVAVIRAEAPTTGVIYAASAADEVWLRPTTPYGPTGLHVEFTSYAGLFDRLGIEAEFMRIGDYKSAPETFVAPDEPSQPALEQTREYLDALYAELTERIAYQRQLSVEDIEAVIDDTPHTPSQALEMGLIDSIVYNDELQRELHEFVGPGFRGLERGYQRFPIDDERWGGAPEIAVVYIDGMITSGTSGGSPFGGTWITGAQTIKETLRDLRRDNNVKAVVVRIDSPGGSAVGSDLIYREIRHLSTRKPVVASMGNVAASGGYYVAAGADEIYATPVTLTGSIGIYAGKFNVEALANRLGVAAQPESRGERAGVFSTWRPWTDSEREAVGETIVYLYELFLNQVADTRPLTPDEVDEVGRGRIWTGAAAEEQGLTDSTGGISDAIHRAEQLAGLDVGEAKYVDRTGAGGSFMSPGMSSRTLRLLSRIGLVDGPDIAPPRGQLPSTLRQWESTLLWPLYFQADEPVFLPPYHISFH